MENMNLLNSLFNYDDIEITKVNKRYIVMLMVIIIITIAIVLIKKNISYINTFTIIDDSVILLVDKDYINKIKNINKIIIDDIEFDYSINGIEPLNDVCMVSIKTNTKLNNITSGKYKILLGKERIFDYIVRIIKNENIK